MSDNDILCRGIKRIWQQAFNLLYQWEQPAQMIGRTTIESLKQQLQVYGNPPIQFINHCAVRYGGLALPVSSSLELRAETGRIDRLAFSIVGHKEAMNLARKAALNRLDEIVQEHANGEHREVMTRDYVIRVYGATYEAPVSYREERASDVPTTELIARLKVLEPYVMAGVDSFTRQILEHRSVEGLRLPPRQRAAVDDDYLYGDSIRLN